MRNYLTVRFFIVFAVWQLTGTIGVLYTPIFVLYCALLPIFCLAVLLDRRRLPAAGSLAASITGPATPELGAKLAMLIRMPVHDSSLTGLSRLDVRVPALARVRFESPRARLSAGAYEGVPVFEAGLQGEAKSLGYEEIRHLVFLLHSPLGLWMRQLEAAVEPLVFRVVPPLQRVPEQVFSEMLARQQLLFQGARVLLRGRTTDQFYSVRKYMYPDSVRHIDQKKTAKYGELMTRTYDSYHNHHLIIALDLGRAMCGQILCSHKHDYYLSACLSLAQHAVRSGDRVSFLAFSQKVHLQIRQVRDVRAFHTLFRGDANLVAREQDSNYALLNSVVRRLAGQRSIVLILSDFSKPYVQESLLLHVAELARTHLTVALGLIDKDYDLTGQVMKLSPSALSRESQTKLLYCYWLQEQFEIFSRQLARRGSGALRVSDEFWMNTVLRVYSLLRSSLRV